MATEVLESGEILRDDNVDKSLKQDLENLAKNINVKEVSSDKVDALFNKLDSVDAEAKNRALQYALKNSKIMVGNTEKSVVEIAEAFDKAVEQDWSTWKIKVKEGAAQEDKDLVEWFLNEKWSSLAYLIQLSSQKASLQASRWYWKSNADKIIDVGADKVFWNQTRRALSWLREWIEWDYTKNVETMDVENFKVENVLELKFISSALKTRIETEAKDENVKWLWSNGNYELKSKFTNNFALKKKVIRVDDPKREENKQYVEVKVGDKKVKWYTITSLEELPSGYKWADPENYDENNKDSYPKAYVLIMDKVKYSFYSNWRCHNGADNKMYNTRDIVDRLKNGWWKKELTEVEGDEWYTGKITLEEEKQAIVDEIKNKFGNILRDQKWNTIGLTSAGKLTISSIAVPNTVLTQDVDLAKCLDKKANVDKRRTELVLNEGIKQLVNKKKAQTWCFLLKKYRGENYISAANLKLDDNSLGDLNPMEKWRIKRYFNKFDYYGIELDGTYTTWDRNNWKIKLVLDDDNGNYKYNEYKNNSDLIIDADKVVNDDYTLNMNEFYKKMRDVILNIIRRDDFE